jgi:hypothetical protein
VPFTATITALDSHGRQATGYNGSVTLNLNDGESIKLVQVYLSGGRGTTDVTWRNVGTLRLIATAEDVGGRSILINVRPFDVSGAFWRWQKMAMMDQLQKHIAGGPNDPFPELKGNTQFQTEYDRLAAVWDNIYFHDPHNRDRHFLFADGSFENQILTGHQVNYYFQGMAAAGYNRSMGQLLFRVHAYYRITHKIAPPANVLLAAKQGFNNYAADLRYWEVQTASGTRPLPPQPPGPTP